MRNDAPVALPSSRAAHRRSRLGAQRSLKSPGPITNLPRPAENDARRRGPTPGAPGLLLAQVPGDIVEVADGDDLPGGGGVAEHEVVMLLGVEVGLGSSSVL